MSSLSAEHFLLGQLFSICCIARAFSGIRKSREAWLQVDREHKKHLDSELAMSSSSQFGISTLILLQVRKITDQRTTKAASDKKMDSALCVWQQFSFVLQRSGLNWASYSRRNFAKAGSLRSANSGLPPSNARIASRS